MTSIENSEPFVSVREKINAAIEDVERGRVGFGSVQDLLTDGSMTNDNTTEGQIFTAGGLRYQRASITATDQHITTAGGVKLYVLTGARGRPLKAFGAVGDGVTDDTAAIQTALAVGGPIHVEPGTYLFSAALVLIGGTTILGDGRDLSKFKLKDGAYTLLDPVTIATNAQHVTVRDVTFDFNRAGTTGQRNSFRGSTGVKYVTLDSVDLINAPRRCLVTNDDADENENTVPGTNLSEYWQVSNCRVLNAGDKCFMARLTRWAQFVNCFAETAPTDLSDPSDSAFEVSRSDHVSFMNCSANHLVADTGPTWRVTNASRYVDFIGGTANGGRQGIFCGSGCRNVKFMGLTIFGSTNDGGLISCSNTENLSTRARVVGVDVIGCTFINCDNEGIVINLNDNGLEISGVNISGCRFIDTGDGVMTGGIRGANPVAGTLEITEMNNDFRNITTPRTGVGFVGPRIGVHTALGAETLSGFITILDTAGNPRKVAVVS
jgi:hypothetical protein